MVVVVVDIGDVHSIWNVGAGDDFGAEKFFVQNPLCVKDRAVALRPSTATGRGSTIPQRRQRHVTVTWCQFDAVDQTTVLK